jgi:hypothetical protein
MKKALLLTLVVCALLIPSLSQAEEVDGRILLKARTEAWEGGNNITFRALYIGIAKNGLGYGYYYLGVEQPVTDWFRVEGVVGRSAIANGPNTGVIRGDLLFHGDWVSSYHFAEWLFETQRLGVSDDLDFCYDKYHLGVESYTSFDISGDENHSYDFGPFVGIDFKGLSTRVTYRFFADPSRDSEVRIHMTIPLEF